VVENREGDWHMYYGIGQAWFQEIIELARHNEKAARATGWRCMRL
jgi:hypothetical protein